jgi:DHA2 family multidrug resistance protein
VQQRLTGLQTGFEAKGADAVTAHHQAQIAIWGMVERQAAMLSYNDVFRFLGGMFMIMLPLLLIMKKPKGGKGPAMAH